MFTNLFIFEIGVGVLYFVQNPVLNFHWLPKIKPMEVRKYGRQIQFALLPSWKKAQTSIWTIFDICGLFYAIHNYSVWGRNANVIVIYIRFEPCSLWTWIIPALTTRRFYGVVALYKNRERGVYHAATLVLVSRLLGVNISNVKLLSTFYKIRFYVFFSQRVLYRTLMFSKT